MFIPAVGAQRTIAPTRACYRYVPASNVELDGFLRTLHDETEPCRGILAHQLVDDPVGDDLIGDVDAQQTARPRIEGGLPQHLRHHLAEPLESRDLGVRPAVAV